MARKDTKARIHRLPKASKKASHRHQAAANGRKGIVDAIETERSRLMDAETILHCVVLAMNEHDHSDPDGPYFQNIVDVARGLVRRSIDQLDSVRLDPHLPPR